ncbi:hypothetical protein HBN50_13610 [Halobacteriovorax sp. GB3]|uniref:hypothetical protein n=1 Tax=Halobacteriovorax sp. GB3 TaxID=2719615 RepID=UPI00235F1E93|nr:hypothetical protein [Halobacteriovorax sp. GB3]MDD0854144.1 hypothetical protein [Halobacteriovorax sp. GB3]
MRNLFIASTVAFLASFSTYGANQEHLDNELSKAVMQCQPELVQSLIDQGANINTYVTKDGFKSANFGYAKNASLLKVIQYTNCGPRLNQGSDYAKWYALVVEKASQTLEVLLKNGANPNEMTANDDFFRDQTIEQVPTAAIGFVTDFGQIAKGKYLKILIKYGLDKDIRDSKGNTLNQLLIKGWNNDYQFFRILVDNGFSSKSEDNSTERFYPASRSSLLEMETIFSDYSEGRFTYENSNFTSHHYDNLLVRFTNDLGWAPGNYNSEEYKKRVDYTFKNLVQMIGFKVNEVGSKEGIHPLVFMMRNICPVTKYDQGIYFDLGELGVKDENKIKYLYRSFLNYIKTDSHINFEYVDKNNVNLLSYSLLSCPNEVSQIIKTKISTLPSREDVLIAHSLLKNIDEFRIKYIPFNNDHRNVEFLKSKNIEFDLSSEFSDAAFDNRLIEGARKNWESLNNYGLGYTQQLFNFNADVKHKIRQYTKSRKKVVKLKNGLKYRFNFQQRPRLVEVRAIGNLYTSRGLNINETVKSIDIHVVGKNLNYKVYGSFNHTGSVPLTELSDKGKGHEIIFWEVDPSVFREEIQTHKQQFVIRNIEEEQIVTAPRLMKFYADLSWKHMSVLQDVKCDLFICDYLNIRRLNDRDIAIKVDVKKLSANNAGIEWLLHFRSKSSKDQVSLVKKTKVWGEQVKFLLELIPLKPKDHLEDELAVLLFDEILKLEFEGKLDREIVSVIERLSRVDFKLGYSKFYKDLRLYLLTNNITNEFAASIIKDQQKLERVLLLSQSYSFVGIYKERIEELLLKVNGDHP